MKRSMLFGVLAMFAVSALSVQNVNAQNEEKGKSTQAINEPKKKIQPNADVSTTKQTNNVVTSDATIQKDNDQQQPMRSMQGSQGQKNNLKAEQKDKNKSLDRTNKKQRPKMKKYNKGEKVINNNQSENKDPNEKPSGTNPKMKKYNGEKIENNKQADNKDPNEKPKTNNPKMMKNKGEKIQNNVQSESIDSNKEIQHEDPHNKNKVNPQGKLQKQDVPAKPNSVIGPKMKTDKQSNTNVKSEADK